MEQGTVERRRRSHNETVGGRFYSHGNGVIRAIYRDVKETKNGSFDMGTDVKGSVYLVLLLDYNSYKYGEWESLLFSSCGYIIE